MVVTEFFGGEGEGEGTSGGRGGGGRDNFDSHELLCFERGGDGGERIVISEAILNSLIFSGRTNNEYHASTISRRATTFVLYVRYTVLCFTIVQTQSNRFKILFSVEFFNTKLFYYQTFFKLGIVNIPDMAINKMQYQKWGHRACLRVSRLLKWGICTSCALKLRIIFIQN